MCNYINCTEVEVVPLFFGFNGWVVRIDGRVQCHAANQALAENYASNAIELGLTSGWDSCCHLVVKNRLYFTVYESFRD